MELARSTPAPPTTEGFCWSVVASESSALGNSGRVLREPAWRYVAEAVEPASHDDLICSFLDWLCEADVFRLMRYFDPKILAHSATISDTGVMTLYRKRGPSPHVGFGVGPFPELDLMPVCAVALGK